MKDQLKAIIIKNLAKMPDFLTESLVFIPKPKEINKFDNNNAYILTSECILIPKNVENVKVLFDDISEFLEKYTNIKLTEDILKEIDLDILDDKDEWTLLDINNPESYNLEIDNNQVRIFSKFEKGLYYGVQTFIQLMKNAFLSNQKLLSSPKDNRNQLILPEIEIKDMPDLKMRGVADDISRGQVFTVKSAKRYIKILSHYKLNFYFLYIEDMFKHSKHPKIGAGRGALTIKEIKEIDKYAKERHVELVPIFECLGHVDNILLHKKYEDLGEFPGSQCFDISNPDVIPFLNDYVSKLSKTFSTNYFHIGCDESFDLGKGKSKEFVEEQGKSKALVDYYEKLYTLTKENNNVNIIMYDDVVRDDEDILKNLNKDLILMHWDYKPRNNYPKVEELLNSGFRVIVSPSMLNWQRHFPDNKHASKNIIELTNIAYKNKNNGCLGVLTSSWGDQRYYSLRENEIYAAILTGAISWTTEFFNYRTFKNEYGYLFYGIEKNRLREFYQLFTLLSSSVSLYYKISIQLPPLFYTYLFKHPFPTKKFETSFKNINTFNDIIKKCLKIYENIKIKVLFEKTNFDYIKFCLDLAKFLVEKIQFSVDVSDALSKSRVLDDTIDKIIDQIEQFKEKTIAIKTKYSNRWLISAKKDGLNIILQLFDFLIQCYDKKIEQLKLKVKFVDPFLGSEWIWINGEYNPEKPIYFRKTVEIYQKPRKAILQCIAGNYMKVFVNNKFIGEIYSRFSLSSRPITQRVKTFNITKKLKEGENIIAVEAYNFSGYQGAFNIYGQNVLNYNRIQQIYSDHWWTCFNDKILESDDWKKLEYDDSHWSMVKSYGRPPNLNGDIFKPDLLEGEISITQDYFGYEEFIKNFIPKQLVRQLAKLLKPFG